jgi:hypothetical protein
LLNSKPDLKRALRIRIIMKKTQQYIYIYSKKLTVALIMNVIYSIKKQLERIQCMMYID